MAKLEIFRNRKWGGKKYGSQMNEERDFLKNIEKEDEPKEEKEKYMELKKMNQKKKRK